MTAQLVTDALVMAIWRRGKPDALLHHSDQGSQYTSEQFQRLIADNVVTCSMSRSGKVWESAAMESFFSSLKTERIARKTYRTRNHAQADVFDYIERFYNPTRRHSTLGYLCPHGSRAAGASSLTSCPRNRQQLRMTFRLSGCNRSSRKADGRQLGSVRRRFYDRQWRVAAMSFSTWMQPSARSLTSPNAKNATYCNTTSPHRLLFVSCSNR